MKKWTIFICCLCGTAATGCGSSKVQVSGKVFLRDPFNGYTKILVKKGYGFAFSEGKRVPSPEATHKILFLHESSKTPIEAEIGEDGTYTAMVPIGTSKVTLHLVVDNIPEYTDKQVAENPVAAEERKTAEAWKKLLDDWTAFDSTPKLLHLGRTAQEFDVVVQFPEKDDDD